jgi:hypothetical protein
LNVDFNASLGDNFENNNDLELLERNENQLYFEQILPQKQSYFSSDDDSDVPLSVRYYKYRKSLPKWIKKYLLTSLTLVLTIFLRVTITI